MDPLVKALLEKVGFKLPEPPPAPTPLQAEMQDRAAKRAQELMPEGWQKQTIHGLDNAADFVRGLNYFPTEEVPKDATAGYGAGALLAAGLPLFSTKGIPGMYSRVEKVVESLPESINANKLWSILKNRTAGEELNWRKVPQVIQEGPAVKKEALVKHLTEHPLDVKVERRGGLQEGWKDPQDEYSDLVKELDQKYGENWEGDNLPNGEDVRLRRLWDESQTPWKRQHPENPKTQYEDYTIPGAKNYREDLITLPVPEEIAKGTHDPLHEVNPVYHSHHWEEPNVLVHVRHNERTLPVPEGMDPVEYERLKRANDAGVESYKSTAAGQDLAAHEAAKTQLSKAILAREKYEEAHKPVGRMIENIQSDWHQRGAHEGYAGSGEVRPVPQELQERHTMAVHNLEHEMAKARDHLNRIGRPFQTELDPGSREYQNALTQALWDAEHNLPMPSDVLINGGDPGFALSGSRSQLQLTRREMDLLNDEVAKATHGAVPNAPFKDSWAELGLKQQLLDIAHNRPDTKWIGIAPASELRARGEVISPEFQDKQLPNTLEKLVKPFGGGIETGKFEIDVPASERPRFEYLSDQEVVRKRDPHGVPETVASLWPPSLRKTAELAEKGFPRSAVEDVAQTMERIKQGGPGTSDRLQELANAIQSQVPMEREIKFPMARLTPEMLAQMKEKGFPLLLALLASRMKPVASHEEKK